MGVSGNKEGYVKLFRENLELFQRATSELNPSYCVKRA